jgi:hypothetical protein
MQSFVGRNAGSGGSSMSKRAFLGIIFFALFSPLIAAQSGIFQQAPQYATGASSNPQAFVVADFNNDGFPDVAVADSLASTVSIFLGKGDGTFTQVNCSGTLTCPVGTAPKGIAAVVFTPGGNTGLAVTSSTNGTVTILSGNGSGQFSLESTLTAGSVPVGVAAIEGTSNGQPYTQGIVVANSSPGASGSVGLFLNNGSGGFGPQTTYTTFKVQPVAIAVGDFNNDGVPDIAVADMDLNNIVTVFLGQAAASGAFNGFGSGIQYPAGQSGQGYPVALAVGDFNGDGNLDLAVAIQSPPGDPGSDNVSIMLGDGTGTFTQGAYYYTAPHPVAVVATKLNDSANPDLLDLAVAAGSGNVVTVFWGNGDGTFGGQVNCGTGNVPSAVAAANLTNAKNGQNDLIALNQMGNSFSVILNNGNNTFQSRLDYAAGLNAQSVVMADFNGDSAPDLAFADGASSAMSVTLGNGDGTFQPPTYYTTGTATDPVFIVEGDFNQDGVPDLAVVNKATSTISIFMGQATNGVPNGTFAAHVDYNVGNPNDVHPVAYPTSVAVGDFNGDGYPDLAVTNSNENSVSILLNGGKASPGTFTLANCNSSQTDCTVGNFPIAIATGYFSGNQTLDLVVINESDNDATVLLGNGDGTFTAEATTLKLGNNPVSVAVGDLNGDGILDLAVAENSSQQVSVLLGNGSGGVGNGTFQPAVNYSTGPNGTTPPSPNAVVIGDFNGDGIPDLALTSGSAGANPGNLVSLLLGVPNSQGKATGTFGAPALFGVGSSPTPLAGGGESLATGDFNQDGTLDLAVANNGSNTVSILLNLRGTKITFTPSPQQTTYGQSLTLTATVAPSVTNGTAPTGTVTFENGSAVIGTSQTLSGGQASISTTSLPAGSNALVALYSGDTNYQANTVHLSQTVNAANSNTSLSSTPNPALLNQMITFTGSVNSPTAQPGGTVTFFKGATSLGSNTLNASGQATLSISSLGVGTSNITAVYSGNSNISGSTSSVLQQVVETVTSPNFSLAASVFTPGSVAPGATASSLITINPVGGLNPSTVKLTCSVSPSATPAATCSVGNISVGSSGQGTASLTFATAGPQAALAPAGERGSKMLFALAILIPAMLMGGAGFTNPGRKRLMSLCFFFVLAGCMAHIACGGGSSNSSTSTATGNSGTPAGTYQVTVSGSASGIQVSISTPLSVTVQ